MLANLLLSLKMEAPAWHFTQMQNFQTNGKFSPKLLFYWECKKQILPRCPSIAAKCNGVMSSSSFILMSLPLSNRSLHTPTDPWLAAVWRAVICVRSLHYTSTYMIQVFYIRNQITKARGAKIESFLQCCAENTDYETEIFRPKKPKFDKLLPPTFSLCI